MASMSPGWDEVGLNNPTCQVPVQFYQICLVYYHTVLYEKNPTCLRKTEAFCRPNLVLYMEVVLC